MFSIEADVRSSSILRLAAAAIACAALALAPAAARAAPAPQLVSSTYGIGGAVGVVFPGTVTASGNGTVDVDTKTGFILQGALDYYVVPRLSTGLYLQYQSVGVENSNETGSVFGVGAAIKARFAVADSFALRPGLNIGYQHGSWSGSTGTTTGLGVGALVEAVVALSRGLNGLIQIGFTTQPAGGNKDIDLTWAPIFYLAVGAEAAQ
jgi:hypothetical protein